MVDGGKRGNGLMSDSDDEGGFAAVAGVEDAAEFVVSLQEGVGFINEKRGEDFFDHAEEGGGADVGGGDGAVDEFEEHAEQSGFAAAFLRRLKTDVGGD